MSRIQMLARLLQPPLDRSQGVVAEIVVIVRSNRFQQQPYLDVFGFFGRRPSSPRHPDADQREQLFHVQRLGHVVVGAGLDAALLVVGHGLRRQRDDRQLLPLGFLRISRVAVSPSITGIMTSMSTRSIA